MAIDELHQLHDKYFGRYKKVLSVEAYKIEKPKPEVKEEKKEKPVRKESADDENADDDDDEEDYEKPALDEQLEHVPFRHEMLSESEMISKSAEFYTTMNKRRTLR